jgi:hypothetical protein
MSIYRNLSLFNIYKVKLQTSLDFAWKWIRNFLQSIMGHFVIIREFVLQL